MKPCEVIALHKENGQIIPLKIKIYENDESNVFVIKSSIQITQSYKQQATIKYKCKIVINDVLTECELTFDKNETKWYINE